MQEKRKKKPQKLLPKFSQKKKGMGWLSKVGEAVALAKVKNNNFVKAWGSDEREASAGK